MAHWLSLSFGGRCRSVHNCQFVIQLLRIPAYIYVLIYTLRKLLAWNVELTCAILAVLAHKYHGFLIGPF